MKNILLTISYDGTNFHGWQRQPGDITVQGYLEQTLTSLFNREILLNGTSRTDAGVHAYGQRASFKADISIPTDRLARVINNALAGREKGSYAISPIKIVEAKEMPEEFHARFDSKGKKYIYKIRNSEATDVFERNYTYHVREPLHIEKMQEAASQLIGTHDFKSFEASGSNPRETTVRTIYDAKVLRVDDEHIEIHVSGDGFLYNMVRIIVGTLVEIGRDQRAPEEMTQIIEKADRTQAGHTAPPYGLYLAEVYYE